MLAFVARAAGLLTVALALIALTPEAAWAWTPGTHVFLGEAVLQSLAQLPVHVADLLRAFPHDFLYGSIAADTSIAKKYAPAGRHCHSWAVGFDVYESAGRDEPLRAFALGYLSHLAADAVAHNYFVPMQLALTSSTTGIGHSYWESRFETHLGTEAPRRAHELLLIDHGQSDGLLDRVLSPTIFSTPTNRRIFRGMVVAADSDSWQRVFNRLTERSRWDLSDAEVGNYLERSFDWVMDLLLRFDRADPFLLDPSGEHPLGLAKRVRREALKVGGEDLLRERALHHFGMPAAAPRYTAALTRPLYEPNRVSSN
ncbi:MAG TPA: zinc dependent phospholipase C family protein [Gemmatimonadaceae bacterium]|nr:zinc dependent phospholipase C family protein [Gemmatimonadaceae bacterium]